MKWRHQLPAYSPLRLSSLLQGLRSATGGRSSVRLVEQWILTTLNARQVLLTDSGTTALSAAIKATGSPVALPAYGCFDLATAVDGAGGMTVLYDVDPHTLGPEPGSLNTALAAGVSAVVGVDFFGIPSTLLANPPSVTLVEDAAQAIGGRMGSAPLGSLGSLAILSFGRGKGLTGGGGGALVANDDRGVELLQRIQRTLSPGVSGVGSWARSIGQWMLSRPSLYRLPASLPFLGLGDTEYRRPHPPAAMPLSCAGIIVNSSGLIEEEVERRRANARRLLATARSVSGLEIIVEPQDSSSGYLRLPLIASETIRATATSAEARRLGIMPGYPLPLNRLPGFENRILNRDQSTPGADRLAASLITLPVHGLLRERDLAALEGWMRSQT